MDAIGRTRVRIRWVLVTLAGMLCLSADPMVRRLAAQTDDFEQDPIRYSAATPDNCVTRLESRLVAGQAQLAFESDVGYLRSVLKELGVPESSQMLVFSKTSFQRQRISPRTPRALYFNDAVYVGFCQGGDVVEISAMDSQLGAVFYTLDQEPVAKPQFQRQGDACLLCHGSSQTKGVPGLLVRSVYPDASGLPLLASGSFRVDQTTPLEHRWGGWYVTGTHGTQKHLGNLIVRDRRAPEQIDNSAGMNITELTSRVDTAPYLTPYSDIVALLVMEHQTEAQNLLTRANFMTRMALYHERALNRELGQPADQRWESTTSRIRSVGEPLVKYFLFCGEPPLRETIRGTTRFAQEFAARGPSDKQGRSLRELDLTRRLFKYPCSYLIYSPAFDRLPAEVHDYVLRRMYDVLAGNDSTADFAHLSAADRQTVLEILRDTKPDLPAYWRAARP